MRDWWHAFSKNPAGWRSLLSNAWRTLRQDCEQGTPTASPDRLCLCLGISRYESSEYKPLIRALDDAKAVAGAFASVGYTCHVIANAMHTQDLEKQIGDFVAGKVAKQPEQSDQDGQTMVVVIYFAGHGLEMEAERATPESLHAWLCGTAVGFAAGRKVSGQRLLASAILEPRNIRMQLSNPACMIGSRRMESSPMHSATTFDKTNRTQSKSCTSMWVQL